MRRLAITAGVLVVLVAGAAVALHLAFPPERVKTLVVRRAEAVTGLKIDVERARFGLSYRGVGINLGGVVLRNPVRPGEDAVLNLKGLEAGVALGPLFRREIRVTRLILDDAQVFIYRDASGALNARVGGAQVAGDRARPPAGGGERAKLLLSVPAAEFHNLRLRYVDERAKAIYEVADLDGELRVRVEPDTTRIRAKFELEGVAADLTAGGGAKYGPLRLALDADLAHAPASGRTLVRRGIMELEAIELAVSGFVDSGPPVGTGGKTELASAPRVDLALASGSFEPAKVLSLLGRATPSDLDIKGTAQMRATVRGPVSEPAIAGALQLTGIEVTPPNRDGPLVTRLSGEARFTRESLETSGLKGELAGSPFSLSARVQDFARPVVTGSIGLDARLADLAALVTLPPDLVIESGTVRADLNFSTRSPDFTKALRLEGTARGSAIGARVPGIQIPVRDLDFTAALAGRQATFEPFRLTLGQSDCAGRVVLPNLDQPSLEVALHSRRLDLNELLGPEGSAPRSKPAESAGGRKPAPIVPIRGTVRVDELLVRNLTARQATFSLVVDGRGIRMDDLKAAVLGGTLNGRAVVDMTNPDSLRYETALKVSGAEANEVLSAITPIKNLVYGQLQGEIDLSGVRAGKLPPAALLTALGNTVVSDGHLVLHGSLAEILRQLGILEGERLQFKSLTTRFRIDRGRVGLNEFRLGSPKYGEIIAGGSIGLDGSLETTVHTLLPKQYMPPELANQPHLMDLLADASGRVPLDFKVTGNVRNPKVKLDLAAIEQQVGSRAKVKLEERAQEEIGKALEEATRGLGDLLGKKRKPAPADTAAAKPAKKDTVAVAKTDTVAAKPVNKDTAAAKQDTAAAKQP